MAREFSIQVGRDVKVLRYTMVERRALEAKFGGALVDILKKRAFSESANGGWSPVGGEWDVQVELLFQGLKHLGPSVTRNKVEGWMQAAIDSEPGIGVQPYLIAAANAVLVSGVLGARYELPEAVEDEADSGKAEPPAAENGGQG